jgi:hypothetical protein
MRRVTAALLAAAIVITACSSPKSAIERVTSAAKKTTDERTARFRQVAPGRTSNGVIDLEHHRLMMQTLIGGVAVESVTNGGTIYIHLPALAPQLGGKTWISAAPADLPKAARLKGLATLIAQVPSIEPTSTIAQLAQTKSAVKIGEAKVHDADTTRYRAIVGTKKVTVDVWVDGHGRAARIRDNTGETTTTELWDFGRAVKVQPPRPADTAPLDVLLRSAP